MEQLEGRNPVLEALQSDLAIHRVLVAKGTQGGPISSIIDLCKEHNVNVQWVDRSRLDQMSQTGRHQGVIAELAAIGYASLDDVLARAADASEDLLLVVLDEIEDPQNLGSIIRTAEAVGAHGVIIPRHRAVGLTAAVARASAGAVAHLPVVQVPNLVQCIKKLKTTGAWVVGTDALAEQTAFQADLTGPLVVVLGSEGKGIGRLLRENCDFLVRLPMSGKVNSLNVSVSAGVILYEVVRQRQVLVKP